jgi:hypothetical protein
VIIGAGPCWLFPTAALAVHISITYYLQQLLFFGLL